MAIRLIAHSGRPVPITMDGPFFPRRRRAVALARRVAGYVLALALGFGLPAFFAGLVVGWIGR